MSIDKDAEIERLKANLDVTADQNEYLRARVEALGAAYDDVCVDYQRECNRATDAEQERDELREKLAEACKMADEYQELEANNYAYNRDKDARIAELEKALKIWHKVSVDICTERHDLREERNALKARVEELEAKNTELCKTLDRWQDQFGEERQRAKLHPNTVGYMRIKDERDELQRQLVVAQDLKVRSCEDPVYKVLREVKQERDELRMTVRGLEWDVSTLGGQLAEANEKLAFWKDQYSMVDKANTDLRTALQTPSAPTVDDAIKTILAAGFKVTVEVKSVGE